LRRLSGSRRRFPEAAEELRQVFLFSFTDMTALKFHLSDPFKFSPSASTELLLNPHNITDPAADGHGFNFLDFPNYLKMHLKFHLLISFFCA